MQSNVLPLPFVALLVYGAIQVLKSIVPGMDRWPNNVTRAAGYALTYAAIIVNARVGAPLYWADLWGLLPTAAAVYGGSALLYHVQDNGPPAPATAPPAVQGAGDRRQATADAAPGTPVSVPSAPDAAWGTTTVSYGPPAEAPVGPSAAASATPPEPPRTPTEAPTEAPVGLTVTYTSGPPTP